MNNMRSQNLFIFQCSYSANLNDVKVLLHFDLYANLKPESKTKNLAAFKNLTL